MTFYQSYVFHSFAFYILYLQKGNAVLITFYQASHETKIHVQKFNLLQVNLFQKLATCAEHVVYQNCSECQNKKKQFMYTTCSELGIFM